MRRDWVHDYETLSNCFVAVFIDARSDDKEVFVIHELRNDIEELIAFLERNILLKEWHISFNGLNFDAQITEYILRDKEQLRNITASEAASYIYSKAQYVIQTQNEGNFLEFKPSEFKINQVDVFKLNHWDNPAKRSSLKWIQYTMDWENIQDMPIPHGKNITTEEEIDMIIGYCINDVESTKQIMYLSKKQISLRNTLTKEYDINLYSASEPRISKELFLHFLSKQIGVSKYELKQLRTFRESIQVKDIILNYIDFKTASFQRLKERFKEVEINPSETKGGFKYSVQYRGIKTHFGLGGIHGARKSGIYKSDKDMIIMSSDVTSFYPNLAIRNQWSPAHLPKKDFCNLYEWFFEERKKISKKDIRNYVYKIILNSTYGLSNDKNSFLYDPEFTMRITINGQLSLCMLYEMLTENIPGAIPLMQNTDGLETLIPREYKDKYLEICKEWEQITNLQLEHDTYSKIILGDVNNYIAVYDYKEVKKEDYEEIKSENPHFLFKEKDDKFYFAAVKCKGRFEFSDLALHKNKSHLVIPKGIFYYFVHGIEPEEYLKENKNIFDYCAGKKINGNWNFYIEGINSKGLYVKKDLQNTIRYYVSNKGGKIIKYNYSDKRKVQLESGSWIQKLFIKAKKKENFSDYDINYDYYTQKIYNEVDKLQPRTNQLKLF
jgi:hypothetical protein